MDSIQMANLAPQLEMHRGLEAEGQCAFLHHYYIGRRSPRPPLVCISITKLVFIVAIIEILNCNTPFSYAFTMVLLLALPIIQSL